MSFFGFGGDWCCNLSGGVALIVWFTTNGMCAKNKNISMWREQAIIEWSRRVISIVACCHGAKLCAHAARDFRLQQCKFSVCTVSLMVMLCWIFRIRCSTLHWTRAETCTEGPSTLNKFDTSWFSEVLAWCDRGSRPHAASTYMRHKVERVGVSATKHYDKTAVLWQNHQTLWKNKKARLLYMQGIVLTL